MKQLVKPNTSVKANAGLCLQLARKVFGAPAVKPSAWEAWQTAIGRHTTTPHPKDVSVPIWFSHYGTYGSPPRYANWGHVVVYVPGRGYLSSPGSGYGSKWFKTIAEIERYFNCKYVGWSEGINGVRVVIRDDETSETNNVGENMIAYAHYKHALGRNREAWAFVGGPKPLIIHSLTHAKMIKRQNNIKGSVRAIECTTEEQWQKFLDITT